MTQEAGRGRDIKLRGFLFTVVGCIVSGRRPVPVKHLLQMHRGTSHTDALQEPVSFQMSKVCPHCQVRWEIRGPLCKCVFCSDMPCASVYDASYIWPRCGCHHMMWVVLALRQPPVPAHRRSPHPRCRQWHCLQMPPSSRWSAHIAEASCQFASRPIAYHRPLQLWSRRHRRQGGRPRTHHHRCLSGRFVRALGPDAASNMRHDGFAVSTGDWQHPTNKCQIRSQVALGCRAWILPAVEEVMLILCFACICPKGNAYGRRS